MQKLVTKDLKVLVLDTNTKTYINLLHEFLLPSDSILEFNDDGCSSSCLFNDIIIHEGSPKHSVMTEDTEACKQNIKAVQSNILLNSTLPPLASVLVVGYEAPETIQEKVVELCTSLEKLRLVVLNTDAESTLFLQKVHSILTVRDFFVHVTGKYTVYVHNTKPEKILTINRTPQPMQVILAVMAIVLVIVGYFIVRSLLF